MNTRNILIGVVILAIVLFFIYRNKQNKDVVSYSLPRTPDPSVFGPKYWFALHDITGRIPCGYCRGFAEKFMVFMHDTVNKKLSKPLYDQENFNKFLIAYSSLADGGDFETSFKEI